MCLHSMTSRQFCYIEHTAATWQRTDAYLQTWWKTVMNGIGEKGTEFATRLAHTAGQGWAHPGKQPNLAVVWTEGT
jgi:hypothetical protein